MFRLGDDRPATRHEARGIASVRIETGLGGALTVPCASGERRFEGLTAAMYSVVLEALDASGSVVGEDFYGASTVRSNDETTFEVTL